MFLIVTAQTADIVLYIMVVVTMIRADNVYTKGQNEGTPHVQTTKVVVQEDQFTLHDQDPVLNIDELTNDYNEIQVQAHRQLTYRLCRVMNTSYWECAALLVSFFTFICYIYLPTAIMVTAFTAFLNIQTENTERP